MLKIFIILVFLLIAIIYFIFNIVFLLDLIKLGNHLKEEKLNPLLLKTLKSKLYSKSIFYYLIFMTLIAFFFLLFSLINHFVLISILFFAPVLCLIFNTVIFITILIFIQNNKFIFKFEKITYSDWKNYKQASEYKKFIINLRKKLNLLLI